MYSEFTADFLRGCALFQKELLSRSSSMSANVSDKSVLIALSLRCLVLTHELAEVDGSSYFGLFENNETHFRAKRIYEQDPQIEISRLPSASQTVLTDSNEKAPDSLPSILEGILQTTQRLMFRRSPEDWPILLYTLCLMRLIGDDFSVISPWMRSLQPASQAMHKAFSILCRLFRICAKDFNPFSDDWKHEEYAVAVKGHGISVNYARRLHEMWLEGKLCRRY